MAELADDFENAREDCHLWYAKLMNHGMRRPVYQITYDLHMHTSYGTPKANDFLSLARITTTYACIPTQGQSAPHHLLAATYEKCSDDMDSLPIMLYAYLILFPMDRDGFVVYSKKSVRKQVVTKSPLPSTNA